MQASARFKKQQQQQADSSSQQPGGKLWTFSAGSVWRLCL